MFRVSVFASVALTAGAVAWSAPAWSAEVAKHPAAVKSAAGATTEFSAHRRRVVVVRHYRAPRVWVAPRRYVYRPIRVYRPYAPVVVGYPVFYSSPYFGAYGWRGCGWGGCGWGGPGWGGPGWGGWGWRRPAFNVGIWW
ncbi:MAG: hypothetical protein AB7K35_10225 [Pseudorhodoplanes sp.]